MGTTKVVKAEIILHFKQIWLLHITFNYDVCATLKGYEKLFFQFFWVWIICAIFKNNCFETMGKSRSL